MSFEDGLLLWSLLKDILAIIIWPCALIASLLIFKSSLTNLLTKITKAELPWGGGTLEFQREATQLNLDANKPDPDRKPRAHEPSRTDAGVDYNELQISRKLRPTASGLNLNYFRELVLRDPNLALAALRMEMETIVLNIATGSKVAFRETDGAGRNLSLIHQTGLITGQQFENARKAIDLCNRAIHGQNVDSATALAVIESTEPLLNDYKEWLGWNVRNLEVEATVK